MINIEDKKAEKILCIVAKFVLITGIVISVCALIAGLVIAISEELGLIFLLALPCAVLLFAPFCFCYALLMVIVKISLNLSETSMTTKNIQGVLHELHSAFSSYKREKTKTNGILATNPERTENRPEGPASKMKNKSQQENTIIPNVKIEDILEEINSQDGDEAEKICKIMEMLDDGRITKEDYDILINRLSNIA